MKGAYYFIRCPEKLPEGSISDIEKEINECGVSLVGVYNVSTVPVAAYEDEPHRPGLCMADGTQMVFCGNPSGAFDFESYIEEVFEKAFISRGNIYQTGEDLWIVRAPPVLLKQDEDMKRLEKDVMAAMVAMNLQRMVPPEGKHGGVLYSSQEKLKSEHGIHDVLREVNSHGLRNIGVFYTFSGVPFKCEAIPPMSPKVRLVEGTEIIAEGPYTSGLKRIEGMHPGMRVFLGGRLVA